MAQNRSNWDLNFNVILVVLLMMVVVANIVLYLQEVTTGIIYSLLWLAFVIVWVVTQMTTQGDELKPVSEILKSPFAVSNKLAAASFIAGWFFLVGLELVLNIVGNGFTITRFSVPFYGSQLASGVFQSFSAAEIGNNLSWTVFNIVWNAGVTEEIVFTVGAMLFGLSIAKAIHVLIFQEKTPFGIQKSTFLLFVATIVASVAFTAAHALNGSYAGIMFLIAFLFKAATIWGVYRIGLFLTFTIGLHQANNFIWLVQQYGLQDILSALFTDIIGIVQLSVFGIILFYTVVNAGDIIDELQDYISTLRL